MFAIRFRLGSLLVALTVARALLAPAVTVAQEAGAFVPPPRTISDITAILDQEKPDPKRRAKAEAEADAAVPAGAKGAALGEFYSRRSQARADLGRTADAIDDARKAIENGIDYVKEVSRYEQHLERQLRNAGDFKSAVALLDQMVRKLDVPGSKGRLFTLTHRLTINHLSLGDINRAESYLKRNQARLAESRSWPNVDAFRSNFESSVEDSRARILEARGRYQDAEAAYAKAALLLRDAMQKSKSWPVPPAPGNFEVSLDFMLAHGGRAKWQQGRVAEAEVDIRRALLNRLRAVGKYNSDTAQMSLYLASLLIEQSRYAEAEKLVRTALEIYETLGYAKDAQPYVVTLNQLAVTFFAQGRYASAKETFAAADAAMKGWDPQRSAYIRLGYSRIFTDYWTRNVEQGIERAREALARNKARKGDGHRDTAMSRAILATGLTFARRDEEALAEFKAAMPVLLATAQESDDEDVTAKRSADRRLETVIEANMVLLARTADAATAGAASVQLAESIRGRSVQNALEASAARAAARTPALAELARKEQDHEKQIGALTGTLNNLLSLAPEERDDAALREAQKELDQLRGERRAAKREIERRFPAYANLVNPKPVTVDDIRQALRPEEALLSFHFGRRSSFVWAVPKAGPIAFSALPLSAGDLEKKVKALRAALEPNATTVGDIPPFDLATAHELYALLLKPVEAGWRPAKSLIVATNGALALLPLGLLPTEPAQIKAEAEPLFADYRQVAWLARTHAVTMIPSASALRTLRQLPATAGRRDTIVGFGDPLFNAEQAEQQSSEQPIQVAGLSTRGIPLRLRAAPQTAGIDSAGLGVLPRLPDTADELRSIAIALEADPSKVLHLGRAANERTIKSLDLAKYRIVAFATHGLVPGELDGLTQPALALTAPNVADVDGDGLLTMEEILGLKLNADWVVLSACNTGAAAGAGAEAASGLGRAFFYAGTRSLLVTNWSVHSASARELVGDLFRRQGENSKLPRAEALRQASMALIDGPGFADGSGRTLFSYAHPIFWAPYSIIGDGGH